MTAADVTHADTAGAVVDMAGLAAVGGLTGADLATHLGVTSLEDHVASMIQPPDHPSNSPDYLTPSPERVALANWLAAATFTPAVSAGDRTFSMCDHCGVLVGGDTTRHVNLHRKLGV